MSINSKNEAKWQELEKTAPANVASALKKLSGAYNGTKMVKWMAGLWDTEVGGFYYSDSARDYEGYYPDIESTHQLIGILTANGAIKSRNADIPESIKAKMLSFIKSCQSERDGYFYHPQWPCGKENLQNDRYGRDLSWSTSFINLTTLDECGDGVQKKQYPNYCILGNKCQKHAETDERCQFPPEPPRSAEEASAKNKFLPDYSSREAFSAWLEEYNADIKVSSGRAHMLASIRNVIASHGYSDIVLDHLDRVQQELFDEQTANGTEPTGLWQTDINYHAVWGLLKYAGYYNDPQTGRELKYAEHIVKTCIKIIALPPDGDYRMNDLYNQWQGIQCLINNMKKYNPDGIERIREILRADATSLIDNSLSKIEPFMRDDGSFAYTSSGNSLTRIYGVPISLGLKEGDVNAVALCCSMYRAVFTCLGYDVIHICTPEDGALFTKLVSCAAPVVKRPVPKTE